MVVSLSLTRLIVKARPLSCFIAEVRVAGWLREGWMGCGPSLAPSIVKVRMVWWWFLSMSHFILFVRMAG